MTEQLADLLDQYLAATSLPPARVDSEGVFTIESGAGILIGAVMLADGRLELFSNPGHVSSVTLRNVCSVAEDTSLEGRNPEAVPGALVRWQSDEAHWGVHIDREAGLVTLTKLVGRLPWHADGLAALVDTFCEEHASWAARLEPEPPARRRHDQAPGAGLESLAVTRA